MTGSCSARAGPRRRHGGGPRHGEEHPARHPARHPGGCLRARTAPRPSSRLLGRQRQRHCALSHCRPASCAPRHRPGPGGPACALQWAGRRRPWPGGPVPRPCPGLIRDRSRQLPRRVRVSAVRCGRKGGNAATHSWQSHVGSGFECRRRRSEQRGRVWDERASLQHQEVGEAACRRTPGGSGNSVERRARDTRRCCRWERARRSTSSTMLWWKPKAHSRACGPAGSAST